MKQLLATVTVLVVFGCLSGCFEDDAVWTPDSSGVVFLRGDGALAHFDIASRETRVLAQLDYEHRGELLEKPAVSPQEMGRRCPLSAGGKVPTACKSSSTICTEKKSIDPQPFACPKTRCFTKSRSVG